MSCLSEDIMVFWRSLEHSPYIQDFEEDGYLCVTFNPYVSLFAEKFLGGSSHGWMRVGGMNPL